MLKILYNLIVIADIIIILILLVCLFIGVKRGLAISLINLFSATINIFLSALLTNPLKLLLGKFGLTELIQGGYFSSFG